MRDWVRRRSRGEIAGAVGLIALLVVATWLAGIRGGSGGQDGPRRPALSVHSNQPNGARALALWLADLGYEVAPIELRPFAVEPEVRLLFVLAPSEEVARDDAVKVAAWVEAGGTLILAAERPNRLTEWAGLEVDRRPRSLATAVPRQPVFVDPPVREVAAETQAALAGLGSGWVPLIGPAEPDGAPIAATARRGAGRILALSATTPFSNAGLGRADNAALVLHLLSGLPPGSRIAFDEYHHGLTEHGTLGHHLLTEPWGWAILYLAGLTFAYLALRGRRFGRSVEALPFGARRSRGEYVTTLAGLLRAGGHRTWLRRHYVAQVKRAIGTRFGVAADLPAREFAAAVALRRPGAAELAGPLDRLETARSLDDATVLDLIRSVERLRDRLVES